MASSFSLKHARRVSGEHWNQQYLWLFIQISVCIVLTAIVMTKQTDRLFTDNTRVNHLILCTLTTARLSTLGLGTSGGDNTEIILISVWLESNKSSRHVTRGWGCVIRVDNRRVVNSNTLSIFNENNTREDLTRKKKKACTQENSKIHKHMQTKQHRNSWDIVTVEFAASSARMYDWKCFIVLKACFKDHAIMSCFGAVYK